MNDLVILCGPTEGPDYDGINSPSGRCSRHGDYLYYCPKCHEEQKVSRRSTTVTVGWYTTWRKAMDAAEGFHESFRRRAKTPPHYHVRKRSPKPGVKPRWCVQQDT